MVPYRLLDDGINRRVTKGRSIGDTRRLGGRLSLQARPGRPRDHLHARDDVVHAARDRTDHLEIMQDGRKPRAAFHRIARRLEADQAGMRCRPPDRAAAIGAERERTHARGDRRHRTTARAAGRQRGIPRIARGAEQQIIGKAVQRELRHIGLAEDDGTGLAKPLHRQFVLVGHVVGVKPAAPGGAQAGDQDVVLDRDRHAVERADRAALLPPFRALIGRVNGAGFVQGYDGIELRIELPDARQRRVDHLARRQAFAIGDGKLGCR